MVSSCLKAKPLSPVSGYTMLRHRTAARTTAEMSEGIAAIIFSGFTSELKELLQLRLSVRQIYISCPSVDLTLCSSCRKFKDEAQTALFKDPVRTAQ